MGLKVTGLTKSFAQKLAVNQISFEMEKPGIFGLIGTNGAGKTTTIRMILGIMRPDSGEALWNGKPITRETLSFGYMPEERGIYMKTTVIEQLVYFGMLRGMNKSDAKASAERLLDRLSVSEYKNTIADKLSKGNQQKIQLAATLIHDPELIILDEPFSGLDPVNTQVLREFILELFENKKYIVMSSHQMSIVEEYCDSILMLDKGKTLLKGNLKDIKASYGHTNLAVSDSPGIEDVAAQLGLKFVDRKADCIEYKITGDDMAESFFKALAQKSIIPLKFEVKEPSLHEIFLEKAGNAS